MRRLLGSVLPAVLLTGALAGALAGCGDDDAVVTDQPGPTSTPPTTGPTKGPTTGEGIDFDLVRTITETGAGGSLSEVAVPLADDAAVQEFTAQFENDTMAANVQKTVDKTDIPADRLLYGAVVAIGCDSPTEVSVTPAGQGLVITANQVPSPQQECFAPMTTVALVLVPASAVS